ncbi:MAG: hypothetical protein ACT4OF_11035 [Caulobacteraceae bacterium]
MRLVLAAAAFAAFSVCAQAQETTTPATPAPPIPPSACAAFVAVPAPPDGATATAAQIREAVAGFEAWRTTTQTTMDCRAAEVRALAAQTEARRNEYVSAQAENQARGAAFQAQLDIFNARQGRRGR